MSLYDQINNDRANFHVKYLILADKIIKNRKIKTFTVTDMYKNSKFTKDQIYGGLRYLIDYNYLSSIKKKVTKFYSITKKGYLLIQNNFKNNSINTKKKIINKDLLSDYKFFYLICINEYLNRINKDYFLT